jgi:hypothetical protein
MLFQQLVERVVAGQRGLLQAWLHGLLNLGTVALIHVLAYSFLMLLIIYFIILYPRYN